MKTFFLSNWPLLTKILIVGTLVYITLIIMVRISGKRTLAQLNAFDFVITVALGSTLASAVVSKDVPLIEGVMALVLLIVLQLIVAWISVHVPWFSKLVKSEPQLLFRNGQFMEKAMKEERVRKDELLQAMRSMGVHSVDAIEAIVLETNGNFSIIKRSEEKEHSALVNVRGWESE